ncbi:MAG: hypothetical protein DRK00_08390, partial [Thermoprotei archaeon]
MRLTSPIGGGRMKALGEPVATLLLLDSLVTIIVAALLYTKLRGIRVELVFRIERGGEIAYRFTKMALVVAVVVLAHLAPLTGATPLAVAGLTLSYILVLGLSTVKLLLRELPLIDSISLAAPTGYVILGLIALLTLPQGSTTFTLASLATALSIALLNLVKRGGEDSLVVDSTTLCMLAVTIYYAVQLALVYPGLALRSGSDLSINYMYSRLAFGERSYYKAYPELLHHAFIAGVQALSRLEFFYVNSLSAFLNLSILAMFFSVARLYHRDDGKSLMLSTALYALFRVSVYIYALYAYYKLLYGLSEYELIVGAVERASLAFCNTPTTVLLVFKTQTLGLLMFTSLFYLSVNARLPATGRLILAALLSLGCSMVHLPELALLAFWLASLSLFQVPNLNLEDFKPVVVGCLSGLVLSLAIYLAVLPALFLWSKMMIVMIATCTLLAVLSRLNRGLIPLNPLEVLRLKVFRAMLVVLAALYLLAPLGWFEMAPLYNAWKLYGLGCVPSFMHPVYLGVVGLVGLLTPLYMRRGELLNTYTVLALLATSFLLGKLVTAVNVLLFYVDYWEHRLLLYQYLPLAIIAGRGLAAFLERLSRRHWLIPVVLVPLLLVHATSSSMVARFYMLVSEDSYRLSQTQLRGVELLDKWLRRDSGFTVAVSRVAAHKAVYAAPPFQLVVPFELVDDPLMLVRLIGEAGLRPFLVLADRDLDNYLKEELAISKLVRESTPIYESSDMAVFRLPILTPPSPVSDTAIIASGSREVLELLLLLALNGRNYTVVGVEDSGIASYRNILVPYDPPSTTRYLELAATGSRVVLFNFNGYSGFCKLLFTQAGVAYADSIRRGKDRLDLSPRIRLTRLLANGESGVRVVASYYYRESLVAPLVAELDVGRGRIIYVNVYPLVSEKFKLVVIADLIKRIGVLEGVDEYAGSSGKLYLVERSYINGASTMDGEAYSIAGIQLRDARIAIVARDQLFEAEVEEGEITLKHCSNILVECRSAILEEGVSPYVALHVEYA